MFKTTKGWTIGFLSSSLAVAGLMILMSGLIRGTPASAWAKNGLQVFWWMMFLYFVGTAPAGACRCWRRKRAG